MSCTSIINFIIIWLVKKAVGQSTGGSAGVVTFDFPRVYSATVPPRAQADGVSFAAEVDFLGVLKDSGGDDVATRISFLIHNEAELGYVKSLNPDKLQIELDLTQDLHDQLNYDDGGDTARSSSSQQPYSTIPRFSCYKSLQGTFDWMNDMVARSTPSNNLDVTITDIGDSFLKTQNENDGYDIWALKVTGKASATTEKGVILVTSGIHPREYTPPELVSRWAETLIDGYGNDADLTALLDSTEIHLVIQANPDGRQVAESNPFASRRKNLNPHGNIDGCREDSMGVDLNRNFPFGWGLNSGSSGYQCSNSYRGPSAASEPEVQAIVNYGESIYPKGQRKNDPEFQAIREGFDETTTKGVFLDIHAYGEIIIWPWYYAEIPNRNSDSFEALANKYRHFNGYADAGPFTEGFLYLASGNTPDWAYGALGAAGMGLELGTTFYQDCAYFEENIIASNMQVLTYAAKTSIAPYTLAKGPDVTTLSAQADGDSLTVTAVASDSAWSSHPTSQQPVASIRVRIDGYPNEETYGVLLGNPTLTVDISNLPSGRHMVLVQATDAEGHTGPVTAAYFTKDDETPDTMAPVTAAPVTATCEDTTYSEVCRWVSDNKENHPSFCDYFPSVASACPVSCNKC